MENGCEIIKIVYVSIAKIPSFEANSVNVINMCVSLAKIGHDVTLMATKGFNGMDIWDYYGISKQIKFTLKYISNGKMKNIRSFLSAIELILTSDVVFTRWMPAAFLSSFVLRKKTIVEYHAFSNKLLSRVINYINFKYGNIVRHIFITKSLANTYNDKYLIATNKCVVLPSGANARAGLDIESEVSFIKRCGYVGSFSEGKGVDTVLRVAIEMPAIDFYIIGGSDKEIDHLKDTIGNPSNVIWYGFLPFSEAQKMMEEFDIALLPNKNSVIIGNQDIGKVTSPNKMIEYMSLRKVIIASDIPVLKEVLKDKENSLLVSAENIQEWKSAIELVLYDSELRRKIRTQAFQDFSENYSWCARAEKSLRGIDM